MDQRLVKAGLTDREVQALALYYADRCTQSEVAGALEVSREWACKMIRKAVAKLRQAGLPVPKRTGDDSNVRPRIISMDPHKMDLMPSQGH